MKILGQLNPFGNARRFILLALGVLFVVSAVGWVGTASAARFTGRSLAVDSAIAGDTTMYTIQFGFPGTASVGSLQMEFCDDPIPYLPCYTVPGLDVSGATLDGQTGETGFSVTQQTTNKLVLSRTAHPTGLQNNIYVLKGVKNPSVNTTFYIRLTSYASSDASGNYIDYGGVVSATTQSITLRTQVPPALTFCVSLVLSQYDCTEASIGGGNYVDFGDLDSTQTYAVQSQIVVRTNARDGYSVSVYGIGVTAGNKIVPSLSSPTPSATGNSQFGINLVANSSPSIGDDQDGPGVNAIINPNYAIPNEFTYQSGDTLITVPGVTDFKRYTVSYVLNVSPDQPPGKYGTTLTYICIGQF